MDRSSPDMLEFYMESNIMDRRQKSDTFPQELLDLCDKEDLEAYDKQIDEEEFENQDDETIEKKSLIEKILQRMPKKKYNLRTRTNADDESRRLEAEEEEPMETSWKLDAEEKKTGSRRDFL